jgi:hypothetical protein
MWSQRQNVMAEIRIATFLFFAGAVTYVYLGGQANTQISNRYYLYVTPPGLFFIIWAAIFTFQAIVNIINVFRNVWTIKQHIILAVNNSLLMLWTGIFNIGNDPAVYVSFLILFSFIPTILIFWR